MKGFISQNIEMIGIVVVGVILFFQRYLSGSESLRKKISDEYKERNAQLEAKIKASQDDIKVVQEEAHKTNLEVARLNGVVTEKDKHIETLTKIIQDKNPETLKLLEEIKDGNAIVHKFMEQVFDYMKKANEELGYQTEILESSQKRDKDIDKASKSHSGSILRTPTVKLRSKRKK